MITLSTPYVTTTTSTLGGQTNTAVTDTLFFSYVEINFSPAAIRAKIQRGTVVATVFTPNISDVWVTVNPDGSFSSSDGSFQGAAGALNVAALSAGLTTAFDGAILASGAVAGSETAS
jgi:hypothetical protein